MYQILVQLFLKIISLNFKELRYDTLLCLPTTTHLQKAGRMNKFLAISRARQSFVFEAEVQSHLPFANENRYTQP